MKNNQWKKRQQKDIYVKNAKKQGYVSRSAFKLLEIDNKYKLIKNSNLILELGSAPGGWSQVIIKLKKNNQKLVCVDQLPMKIINNKNYHFINDDFTKKETINSIKKKYKNKFNLILSDLAPNTTGHSATDHHRIINIAEEVIYYNSIFLKLEGNSVIKIWQGNNQNEIYKKLSNIFNIVEYFKPDSSRKESSEIYLICLGYNK